MDADNFLKEVKLQLDTHPLFDDPYITEFKKVKVFELDQAQHFASLYYPHILKTRLYQASALGSCPDEQLQFVLSDILYDEYGCGDNTRSHMQLYRNFMSTVGCQIQAAEHYPILPELAQYIDTMEQLTRNGDWLSAVAAVGFASEWPIPKYYSCLLEGFKKIPGITEDALELFSGHITLDVEHSKMIEAATRPYLNSSENQQRFLYGIEQNMQARRKFHAALHHEIFVKGS
ncbi:MAG: iron-containing redox enzyme family protein [Gammaproteobacteria bacterium]|nr:iron-containing redox enzyme family protein [Gammaproteobacteria bacterium]